jgi:anti-sigma regulatory factor (Ser/Thr protein kinase)
MTYWSRSFQGLAESLSEVRRFTAAVLGDRPGVDLVVLAASELAGNAVLHSASGRPGGQFVVHLASFADRWQIRVDDEGGLGEPVLTEPGEEEPGEAGRGLALIAAVSRSWGVLGDHYARAVWAEIPHDALVEDRAVHGVLAGGAVEELEAVLDAIEAEHATQPTVLAHQSSDAERGRPSDDGTGTGRTSPEPSETPPSPDEPDVRRPREAESCGLPSRARLRAAGVTELEAMLIEMAYAETVGRV